MTQSIQDGGDFVFSDQNEYSFYLKGSVHIKSTKNDLDIDFLRQYLIGSKIDLERDLNNIMVKIYNATDHYSPAVPLKQLLEFVEGKQRACLIAGNWYQFSQNYIKFLTDAVDSIPMEKVKELVYDINEDVFNKRQSEENGYINRDKVLEIVGNKYKFEQMDLYKDETLYFVKFGIPQKLNYVIDQAVNTIKLLQNNQTLIRIADQEKAIKSICLWLVLDRKKINKVSEINSLIFHMKLLEWKRLTSSAGFLPFIKIQLKVDKKST